MVQPPVRPAKEKIIRKKNGGLYILCHDDNYAGMYPGSLSEILECSLPKANFIIETLEKLSDNLNLKDIDTITDTVFNISKMISDPPSEQDIKELMGDPKLIQPKTLISIEDISEILSVTHGFAQKLYDGFNKPIHNDSTLEAFLSYVDQYLVKNHNDMIPQDFTKTNHAPLPEAPEISTLNQTSAFDAKKLDEILNQKAPTELNVSVEIDKKKHQPNNTPNKQPIATPQESEIVSKPSKTEEQEQQKTHTQHSANNFEKSPYFASTSSIIQEFLEIDKEDAELILTSPEALNDFLDLKDTNMAKDILDKAANGDMEALLETMDTRIEGLLRDIADNTMRNILEGNTSNPTQSINVQKNTPQKPLISGKFNTASQSEDTPQPSQSPQSPQSSPNQDKDKIPDTLPDILNFVFEKNNRITAKSLLTSFEMFGVVVSQDLARYIIEEGGYGGNPPNDHRIMDKKMIDKMVTDINKAGDLKAFIKIYLQKINNDLKSMLGGG